MTRWPLRYLQYVYFGFVFSDILPFSCSEGDIDSDPISCGEAIGVDFVVYSWCWLLPVVSFLLDLGGVVYEEIGDEGAIVAPVSSCYCVFILQ